MTEIEPRVLLRAIYRLMNVTSPIEVEYTQEEDGSWSAELMPDGKVIDRSELGCGQTKEDALNDACDRFFNITPTLDFVPIPKLLKLLAGDEEYQKELFSDS